MSTKRDKPKEFADVTGAGTEEASDAAAKIQELVEEAIDAKEKAVIEWVWQKGVEFTGVAVVQNLSRENGFMVGIDADRDGKLRLAVTADGSEVWPPCSFSVPFGELFYSNLDKEERIRIASALERVAADLRQ